MTIRSHPHGAKAFTLVEIMVAMAISSMVALSLTGLVTMAGRMDKSIFAQQRSLSEAKSAIEFLNREIHLAAAPLRVVDATGNPALAGHRVEFSRDGEAVGRRAFQLVSTDDDMLTSQDNRLIYDPNTAVGGDEVIVCRMISPFLDNTGTLVSFRYQGARAPLSVTMRTGDSMGGNDPHANDHITGPGLQGLEIFINISPRN